MKTKKCIQTMFLGRLLRIAAVVVLAAGMLPASQLPVRAALPPDGYATQGSIDLTPATAQLTAVDPLAYFESTDVIPARPFLYSVDANGITITRFNDNAVVGSWPWPDELWITLPDGGQMAIPKPSGGWEPVAMTVSFPTAVEFGNRIKEIPDLTPPWTFVYVVMAHSGYEWVSAPDLTLLETANVRDHLVANPDPETDSSVLVQINVNDPSFSTSRDPAVPVEPHIAGAILGHEAGQPVYDPKTGNIYVGNMPSVSLPTDLASFVSVIGRIPDTVAAEEREIPGIGKPVIRCGPQHPEVGIPVGKPQAYACYDPGGAHIINDNEHVGSFGEVREWDTEGGGEGGGGDPGEGGIGALALTPPDEQYVWEFRNLPFASEATESWLTPHTDLVTGQYDGILYGTPPETGEWYGEARVHNLADEYGVFSDWTPIRLLVVPTAEYLPIKVQFAVGTPASYPLEGTGSCELSDAPAWVQSVAVLNGCVVMGRAPISGEYYNFTMPGFRQTGYPDISLVFSGNVVGGYGFDPLPAGVGISGLAWHQVSKVADPSTETAVLSGEFIGVQPSTGQLYQVLQTPGQPQPPNERPAETALILDVVSAEGAPLGGSGFGQVAVEADRDIFVAADGAVIKVSGGTASTIPLGFQPASLSLDSDLRPAIIGAEPGQVDHGALWAAGAGNAAVIDTDTGTMAQPFPVSDAASVTVDFGPRWAYVATGSETLAIFGPAGSTRPPMEPRIWSSEELNFNRGNEGAFRLMATGDPLPTLDLLGDLPGGIDYIDIGDGFPWVSGTPAVTEGGDGYAYNVTATNAVGSYAQAFGITVYAPSEIITEPTTTFTVGSASSFTLEATSATVPILYTWDEEPVMAPGVQLVDHENGTAGLQGTPTTAGTYTIAIGANTGFPVDAQQTFTLIVNDEGTAMPPTITSSNTALFDTVGAPFSPDQVAVTSTGSPTPTLSIVTVEGQTGLPFGVNFIDNGDSTGALGSGCQVTWPGMEPECLMALFEETEGTYTFTIRAENSNGVAEQEFTLVLETATSIMTPPPTAPANLSFEYTFGGTLPAPQIFAVGTLGDIMPYAAVTTTRWLEASPVSGTVPTVLSVSIVPEELAKLAPGTYTGSILVTSAGTDGPFATALVTLTVTGQPVITLSSDLLSFAYTVTSGKTPLAQTVSLTSGGLPLSYAASTSAAWLHATPANGTTPGDLTVSVDPSKLGIGTYMGAVIVEGNGASNGPQSIIVTLNKKATSLTEFAPLTKLSLNIGSGPEGLALDRTTHQFFINTGNEAAAEPYSADENATSAETEAADPAAGNAVFRFDPATTTVVGRTLVHSGGEYVAVNSKTGLVYHASQGTGEIGVIDESTDEVVGFIELWGNGGLYQEGQIGAYQPYQIAVDEAQNIIYVGAKAPLVIDPAIGADGTFPCKAIHEMPDDEYDCWNPGSIFVIDGKTNQIIGSFLAGDDPEGVVFAAATGKVYVSNEDDGSVTVAKGAIRNKNGSFNPAVVIGTIIKGSLVAGWWQPTCDSNNYCGERGQAALWPQKSACSGLDDEAEEADKMAVDPQGNVYIIDDRYRVAKINGSNDKVTNVLGIPGYECSLEVPDGSTIMFKNTANNIAFSAVKVGVSRKNPTGTSWRLYITSEQNTISLIDPTTMTLSQTITVEGAVELDAITTDPAKDSVFVTDEDLVALWILQGKCADGVAKTCVLQSIPPARR